MKILYLLLGLLILVHNQVVYGQKATSEEKKDPLSSSTFGGLKFRAIGPALTSGRIIAFAVNPSDRSQYYVGVASGGVWKTTNAGTTWTPVFDNEGSYSIGAVTLDPKNPATVWVGTGELNSQRSVAYGDGIYRSDDGGKSWKNMGLKTSEHIARIIIDPRSSNTLYVASQGRLWGPGGERGLFKTTDGGKTWKASLSISENTGVTDVIQDPVNPDVLYAAAYQRRRHVWTLINGGPESAIYKSTDAGETWTKLKSGLPSDDLGRIGLAISPVDNKVLYATVEAANKKGGIFRSTDYGATWEKRNPFDATALYYSQIVADPKDVDRLYILNTFLMVSDDGGKTLNRVPEKFKHVDTHAMWIDPKHPNYYLVGCDGGIYESFDRGENWNYKSNLSVTQFYDLTVDNATPFYNVYGGTQDNFTLGGPSQTRSASGITNADWFVVVGGDGFRVQVDPQDPNIIYGESQYGGLVRFDKRTGEFIGIKPQEAKGDAPLRWNWDSPLIISPHSNTRLYFAANKLFRSDDRGNSWKVINNELSRAIDRNKLPVMDKVWGVDAVAKHASTSFYGNATALTESPKKEGLIYVGSDDGLIQITEDGGNNWRKIEKFPSVPDTTYVTRLFASQHDTNTVYASFDNHKNSDFKPYLLKSTDTGKTWSAIASNLPENGPVLAFAEDHINPNLLFVGTEFGLFFTIDAGKKWIQLKSGLPTIAIKDLVIQKRENDLVLATFGRGFYILDNYSPLRTITLDLLSQETVVFPVKDPWWYIQAEPLGGQGKSFQGDNFFVADNPAFGATITYYLKDSLKTKKQKRQEAEKEAEKNKQTAPYPTPEQLRAEDEEPTPEIILTITDSNGNVVRKFTGPASAGINRVTWNLRYPPVSVNSRPNTEGELAASSLVLPGTYKVSLAKQLDGQITPIGESQTFTVKVLDTQLATQSDRVAHVEFQKKAVSLQRAVSGALQTANELKVRLGNIRQAAKNSSAPDNKLITDSLAVENKLNEILLRLRGDNSLRSRNENVPISIAERASNVVDDQYLSTAPPTQTQLDSYKIASEEFTQELNKLRTLLEVDIKNLEKALDAIDAPWTPGRLPDWKEK